MSRYSIFGEKSIVAKSQWVKIYGTDDTTFTYNDKQILTTSDLPPPFSVAPVGSSPNVAGLSFSNGVLNGQPATQTYSGFMSTVAQTFGGDKTFNGAVNVGTNLGVTGTSTLGGLLTAQNGETVTGPVTFSSIYGATPNTTTPKFLTVGTTGSVSNFTPVVDMAQITLANGTSTTNYASPVVVGMSSIIESGTGISIDTVNNCIQVTKPGLYFLQFQLQLNDPGSGNLPSLYTQMQGATAATGPWAQGQSYQNAMMPRFTGLEQAYDAHFTWRKHSDSTAPDFIRFLTAGNCYPGGPYSTTAAGVAPGYSTGLIYMSFVASPTVY